MTQLENNLAICLILTENKITVTVKISIYFLSPVARLTKVNTEVNIVLGLLNALKKAGILNFPLSRTFAISNCFAGPAGDRDGGCPLYS